MWVEENRTMPITYTGRATHIEAMYVTINALTIFDCTLFKLLRESMAGITIDDAAAEFNIMF